MYGHAFISRCSTHPEREAVTKDGLTLMCMACSLRAMQHDHPTDAQTA